METNSTDYIEGVNSNQIVLSILQEQYPGLMELPSISAHAYAASTVTPRYNTPGAINHYPELIPLDRSENGVIQIDGDDDTKSLNIPLQKLTFVDINNYNEIIDTEYTYFVDVEDIASDNLPDIVGKFIIMPKKSIPTINGPASDIHLYYMLGDIFPNLEYFQVFYGKEVNGRPILYRIPDYKTLEVMLVARDLRYNVIQIIEVEIFNKLIRRTLNDTISIESLNAINDAVTAASENNAFTPDQRLNMYVKEVPVEVSRTKYWSIQTRFKSGYEPGSPFNRDPVDYIGQSVGVDLPTTFDKATSLEKLRDKYEGRIVLFKNLKDATKGSPDADDLEGCRMLFYGRWRPVFSLDILTLYGTETGGDISFQVDNGSGNQSGFNLSFPIDGTDAEKDAFNVAQERRFDLLRTALRKLVDSGVIIILNDDGINSPIWNSFPHALQPLQVDEYKAYLKLADVFDVDYLAPYEPRGSIKYYDPQRNGARGPGLFPGNRLINADESAPGSLKTALNEQIESEMNQLNAGISDSAGLINALQVEINDLIDWKHVADDIVDGENNRFKYVVSNSVNVLKRGTGTRSLDNYFEGAAIGSGIGTAFAGLATFFTLGLAAPALAAGALGTAAYARAADQFEFGNPQERLYKDKINTLSIEYDQLLSVSAGLMQVANTRLEQLESIRNEINADTFITAFDNYQARINDIDAEGMIATIGANISQMQVVRTNSINAYTHFLGILNREVGQANDGLSIMDMRVSIQNFRDSLATTVVLDENIINNLI
jgi:hypothetical protein